jgi:hypothetical protein
LVSYTKGGTQIGVFENGVLRRIFGPKREEVTGGWRRLYSEELHNLYVSSDIIRVIKSNRMKWSGHVARMEEMRNPYKILSENLEDPEDLRVNGRITL